MVVDNDLSSQAIAPYRLTAWVTDCPLGFIAFAKTEMANLLGGDIANNLFVPSYRSFALEKS
jgi:hypothetical protein